MSRFFGAFLAIGATAFLCQPSLAIDLQSPGDFIIGIDHEQDAFTSNPAGGEPAPEIIDGTLDKYLNFAKRNSGIIVTPSAASTVQSMVFTTANDDDRRDPAAYALYGTNDPITSLGGSTGQEEDWIEISSGPLSLTAARDTVQAPVGFANGASYTSYRLVFPEVKDAGGNSMQIAEVQFYPNNDGTGTPILAPTDPILDIDTDLTPDGESAVNLIDGDTGTKFLSFAKENSGVVITPSIGPSVLSRVMFNLANDSEGFSGRDPIKMEVYGTNDPVLDVEDGSGLLSNWTLISTSDLNYAPEDFGSVGPIHVGATTTYESYKIVFPELRDSANANSLQISELRLLGSVPEPGSIAMIALGLSAFAVLRLKRS